MMMPYFPFSPFKPFPYGTPMERMTPMSRYGYRAPAISAPVAHKNDYSNYKKSAFGTGTHASHGTENMKLNLVTPEISDRNSPRNKNREETKSSPKDNEHDKKEDRHTDDPFFEILGIQLYFDDLLILGLLFFLYTEGVKDYTLFMSLILLLMS